jgi:hypothetical protein
LSCNFFVVGPDIHHQSDFVRLLLIDERVGSTALDMEQAMNL